MDDEMQEFETENERGGEDVSEIHKIKENDLEEICSGKFDDNVEPSMTNRVSELENEIQDIKLFNKNCIQDIVKHYFDVYEMQNTAIEKYTEFDNIKSQVNKHEYEISRIETLLKRIEELEKKVASWQECYEENQKTLATVMADKESIKLKMTDFEKLLEIKKNETQIKDEERALEDKQFNKIKPVNDTRYSVFTSNRSTEYKITNVPKNSANISNEIKEMLAEEYNIKTNNIDKEYQVERITHMDEGSNTKFTKQVLKTKNKHPLKNLDKIVNYVVDENIPIKRKLKKIHKIQENNLEKISFSSSQKTRKFDDNVKQVQTVLQKNNETDIKSDEKTVTALEMVKKMDEKQRQKTRKFDDNAKQVQTVLQKNNETDIKSDEKTVTALKMVKKMDEKQRQKTRKFDDNVKQVQTVLQKNNETDIKSDEKTVTALKIVKKMDEKQRQKTRKFDDNAKQVQTVLQKNNETDIKSDEKTVTALKIVKKMDEKQRQKTRKFDDNVKQVQTVLQKNDKTDIKSDEKTVTALKMVKKMDEKQRQKTRKFDDNVKQAQTVLQKSNESDIKSDGKTVTALKMVKKMDEQQKYEKISLKKKIKKLNKTIDKNKALLKQKNCSQSDLEKNMKKIIRLINQLQQCEERLTKYEDFNADKLEWKKQVSELENEMRNIKLYNIKNLHDIVDFHSKINRLQITTKKFESEFDNVKSQINQHDECKISREETMKRIEKLQKIIVLWKE